MMLDSSSDSAHELRARTARRYFETVLSWLEVAPVAGYLKTCLPAESTSCAGLDWLAPQDLWDHAATHVKRSNHLVVAKGPTGSVLSVDAQDVTWWLVDYLFDDHLNPTELCNEAVPLGQGPLAIRDLESLPVDMFEARRIARAVEWGPESSADGAGCWC